MQTILEGKPTFAYLRVVLEPGESITAEASSMSTMDADLDMEARFNGGFFPGLLKKFLGGESLFVNVFTNKTQRPRTVTLVQATPGDMMERQMSGGSFCLQPGAYICSTPGISLGVEWAGIRSFLAREGLFKLKVGGTGTVWFGAYGGLMEREIDGEFIVDSSHLVGYEPGIKLKLQLAGGLFSSFFSGEGVVTRLEGKGKIITQSRSLTGLAAWLTPRLWR